MKKLTILIFALIGLAVIGGYYIARKKLSTPNFSAKRPKDSTLQAKGKESIIDLRPAIIEKLQQIVSSGSDGLYALSIHEVEPDILNKYVILRRVALFPDTARMNVLKKESKLPGSLFTLRLDSIKIDGLGLEDIINSRNIALGKVVMSKPRITLNKVENPRLKEDTISFYQRIEKILGSLKIDQLDIEDGSLAITSKGSTSNIRSLDVHLKDILVDSSSKAAAERFFFAKEASLSFRDLGFPSKDKLYQYNVGQIDVEAQTNKMTAKGIELVPKIAKAKWAAAVKAQKERYTLSIPQASFTGINWQSLFRDGSIFAKAVSLSGLNFYVFLDRNAPSGRAGGAVFPSQLIMQADIPVDIDKLTLRNSRIVYEEVNPDIDKSGVLTVSDVTMNITNITNIKKSISAHRYTRVRGEGKILEQVPTKMGFDFDMQNAKNGVFSATLDMGEFEGAIANPLSQPLGLFGFASGHVHSLHSEMTGNRTGASGTVKLLYDDLKIKAMEEDMSRKSRLDKKDFTSFLANLIVIKKANPLRNKPVRIESGSFKAAEHASFMNLVWKTSFVGILKTINAPVKLANPK